VDVVRLGQEVDGLRRRADANTRFNNRIVGALLAASVLLGAGQWVVLRQVAVIDDLRKQAAELDRRVMTLEIERAYDMKPFMGKPR
jgi:hypothetical protein